MKIEINVKSKSPDDKKLAEALEYLINRQTGKYLPLIEKVSSTKIYLNQVLGSQLYQKTLLEEMFDDIVKEVIKIDLEGIKDEQSKK